MSLKAKVEAIIYAAEEPITLEQISLLLKDIVLADLASAKENAAIEQADSAAEAAAETSEAQAAEETALLPELELESAELNSLEPGPLMPEEAAPVDDEPSQSSAENASDETAIPSELEPVSAELGSPEPGPLMPEEAAPADAEPLQGTAENASENASDEASHQEEFSPQPTAEETLTDAAPAKSAAVDAPDTISRKRQPKKSAEEIAEEKAVRTRVREILVELITDYAHEDRGMEIRQVAGGFRMATKPEHHDVVRAFAKSLKPPIRLSLAALETLAVIAYKQPITAPEIGDIRGVESGSVLGTLLDRKLITTSGRKQVIGRPMQYKTSKDFLLRFGLNDVNELPSMEEFSQLASDGTIEIAPSEPQENRSLFEPDAAPHSEAESQSAPQSQNVASLDVESKELEANDQGSHVPELPQPDAAEPAASQPQSEAESSNVPEAEHPLGSR
jgi:segregation and condensation protein B